MLALQVFYLAVEQHARSQNTFQCLLSCAVLGYVKSEATLFCRQKRIDRPVFAVRLAPEHTTVLELCQWLQLPWAGFNGAKVGTTGTG